MLAPTVILFVYISMGRFLKMGACDRSGLSVVADDHGGAGRILVALFAASAFSLIPGGREAASMCDEERVERHHLGLGTLR